MSRRQSGSLGRSASGPSHPRGSGLNEAGSPTAAAQAVYCVNPVFFENCGALLKSPTGLTASTLLKVLQGTTNKTSITLATWKKTAMSGLGLPESTAYAIFDVFFAVSGGCIQSTPAYWGGVRAGVAQLRQESNRALLQKMGGTVDEGHWPAASTARQVSLPGLLIFLLCQLFVERQRSHALTEPASDAVAEYVRQHLHDFISAVAVTRTSRLTIHDAVELGYLLREVVNGVEQPFGPSIGFLWQFNEKTIDVAVLSQYLRVRIRSEGEIKKASSSATAWAANDFGFNNVVLRDLSNTVHITSSNFLPDMASRLLSSSLTIARCSQVYLYAPTMLPHTKLFSLTNCTLYLGPVSGVLLVQNCHHCCISAMCGAVIVSGCSNVTLYVCVNTPPVLLTGENAAETPMVADTKADDGDASSVDRGVRFAPYNSFYPAIELHINTSGISPLLNLWNVGLPGREYTLPPSEFQSMPFPFTQSTKLSNTTRTNPCPLPAPYCDALNRRLQRLREVNESIGDANARLRSAGRNELVDELHHRITAMFRNWLKETGQEHVLAELSHSTAPSKAPM